jgi:hypothetical protein
VCGSVTDNNAATRYGHDRINAVDTPDPQTVVVRFNDSFAPWAILLDIVLPQHILANQSDFNASPYHQHRSASVLSRPLKTLKVITQATMLLMQTGVVARKIDRLSFANSATRKRSGHYNPGPALAG